MCIIIALLSFEISAGIMMEALAPEWQYAVGVTAVFLSCLLCRTPMKVVKNKLMAILFTVNIAMMLINVLNIFFVHNWGNNMILINLALSAISLSYYYISHYILTKTEKA